jgi:hypothetical protein
MTVLTVVMAVTLLLAIGVLAVRNASTANQIVGYSRQSSQTAAAAELGTSAAVAEFGSGKAAAYISQMVAHTSGSGAELCVANKSLPDMPCARMFLEDLEASTRTYSSGGEGLFRPRNTTTKETGSFGMASAMMGDVYVEITERGGTGRPVAGTDLGGTNPTLQYAKVTLTTSAQVRPTTATDTVCNSGVAKTTSRKVMRARVVVGPI